MRPPVDSLDYVKYNSKAKSFLSRQRLHSSVNVTSCKTAAIKSSTVIRLILASLI